MNTRALCPHCGLQRATSEDHPTPEHPSTVALCWDPGGIQCCAYKATRGRVLVSFSVAGNPISQPRPRVTMKAGFASTYVPRGHAIHAWRAAVQYVAAEQRRSHHTISTPCGATITLHIQRRERDWSFKGGVRHLRNSAPTWATTKFRGDIDNLAKPIIDACVDGGLLADDALVCRLEVWKLYEDVNNPAGATITIHSL